MPRRRGRFFQISDPDLLGRVPTWVFWVLLLATFWIFHMNWAQMGVPVEAPPSPVLSGRPAEIVALWNQRSWGLGPSSAGEALRERFVQRVTELVHALDHNDARAAERARSRLAAVFRDLDDLRQGQGL